MIHYASLLRGVNLGNTRKVKMAELRKLYEVLGLQRVESYLQSGNVVFDTDRRDRDGLAGEIQAAIGEVFGFDDVDVFLRTGSDLDELLTRNPFAAQDVDPAALHVTFLPPGRGEDLSHLDAARYAPDLFALGPQAVYLHCPNGYGRTKLTNAFFEKALGVRATTRNWRTVTKLLELVRVRGES